MKKIAIVGCAGSGKTTLTSKIQKIIDLPVYHLDQYYWKPNWQEPKFEDFEVIHSELCNKESWIIDGIYTKTLTTRFESAEIVIFLDIPRYKCLYRVIKRMLKYYGKTRPSAPAGCPEKINFEFFKFLKWIWNFNKNTRPQIISILELFKTNKKIYVLKSNDDIENFLTNLKNEKI